MQKMYKNLKKIFFIGFISTIFFIPTHSHSQTEIVFDREEYYRAKVVSIIESRTEEIPGTGTQHSYQRVEAKILNKDKRDQMIIIDNDYLKLQNGDVFFTKYVVQSDGSENYTVSDIDRSKIILFAVLVFVALVLLLGGKHGFFALLSLGLSYIGMHFVLFPGIIAGHNPILVASLFAFVILFCIMYVTHGISQKTHSAFLGSFLAILVTVFLSYAAVMWAKLSGFTDDETIYLNFNTAGALNFQGLLLGAIIIGVIGIIDDVAIMQASVVAEIKALKDGITNKEVFTRAMHVGKDHTSAVVNSLVLAYTGASLPLVLLMYTSNIPILELINKETIATEIIRTIVGSIGLILAVPITTLVAVFLVKKSSYDGKHFGHKH